MLKRIIKFILYLSYTTFIYFKIVKPKIIVMMDGGICSQMHQYLLGCIYKENGYLVAYNLAFFEQHAKDMNGRFDRNFDLLKAFPHIDFQHARRIEKFVYPRSFSCITNYFDHTDEDVFLFDIVPPKYLGGYYHSPKTVWTDLFRKYFYVDIEILDNWNKKIYEEIGKNDLSVAIHVRRGDLKIYNSAYGNPASIEYFQKAISYMYERLASPFYYFFSDEPGWVEEELIKELPILNNQYKIVNINASDKGYMDLFLIAGCAHQITSKGSLGKFGALLMDKKEKNVVLCDDPVEYVWKERLLNPVFL